MLNITNLTVGQSCSYKVTSKCGFPAFDIDNPNIDVTIIKKEGKDKNDNNDLLSNDTLADTDTESAKSSGGKIKFDYGKGLAKDTTCGRTRKIYVTLTNIASANGTRIL